VGYRKFVEVTVIKMLLLYCNRLSQFMDEIRELRGVVNKLEREAGRRR
jgi:hypothetical protein